MESDNLVECKDCRLFAPEAYWKISEEERFLYRCGPGKGILEKLIPDTWRFGWPFVPVLRITQACSVHDFMYSADGPDTIEQKELSDRVFRNNLIILVELASKRYSRFYFPITRYRLRLVNVYYRAVRDFGGPAFWSARESHIVPGPIKYSDFVQGGNVAGRILICSV